eukprot:jgi/Mesen1/1824/ME000141S00984
MDLGSKSQRKPKQSTDVHAHLGMAPVALEPRKRNEVIMTREEAQKKRPPKGYAFEPVAAGAEVPLPQPTEVSGDSDAKKARHLRRLDSSSSARFDVKAQRLDVPPGTEAVAAMDDLTKKRKLANLNVNVPDDTSSELPDDGPGDGYVEVWRMSKHERNSERKRLKRALDEAQNLARQLEEKLREARSRMYPSASESTDEARKRARWTGNGPASKGGMMHPPQIDVPTRSHQEKFTRQTSLQVSDMTPGSTKEKRTPKANVLYNNADFLSGSDKFPMEKTKLKTVLGVKRGPVTKGGDREAKRARVEAARSKRTSDIFKMCGTVVRKLISQKFSHIFGQPVDWKALGLIDYPKVVTRPMDLATINSKLKTGKYKHPEEVAEDVRLMYNNAILYNGKVHEVGVLAQQHLQVFEENWRRISEKLLEDEIKTKEEDEELEQLKGSASVQALQQQIADLREQVENKGGKQGKGPPARPSGSLIAKPKPQDRQKRDMTLAEKRKLSVNLGKLPGDKLGRVVQIISEKNPSLNQTEDEIELDIDSLDNDSLWELDRYVANCMKSKNKNKRRAEDQARAGVSGSRRREGEDDIDIDDEAPAAPSQPVVVEKEERDGQTRSSSSGSSSSDDSGSSSSDSDSGSESGSESDGEAESKHAGSIAPPEKEPPAGSGAVLRDHKGSPPPPQPDGSKSIASNGDGVQAKKPILGASKGSSKAAPSASASAEAPVEEEPSSDAKPVESSSASGEKAAPLPSSLLDVEMAPGMEDEKMQRAALLRAKYADIIVKKSIPSHLKNEKIDPKMLEEIEKKHKEERARLEANARAAKLARQRQEAEAAAEAKKKLEAEREAARRALTEMGRTVELDENYRAVKDLHLLGAAPGGLGTRMASPGRMGREEHAREGGSGNPLESLGLYMRNGDEDEGDESGDEEGGESEGEEGVLENMRKAMGMEVVDGDGSDEEGEDGDGDGEQVKAGEQGAGKAQGGEEEEDAAPSGGAVEEGKDGVDKEELEGDGSEGDGAVNGKEDMGAEEDEGPAEVPERGEPAAAGVSSELEGGTSVLADKGPEEAEEGEID